MKTIGEILRELREGKNLLLRQVAAAIEIDPTLLSKIERGDRLPTKDQVIAFAKYFKEDAHSITVAWLSDKVVDEIKDQDLGAEALKVAEQKIRSKKK